MPRDERLALAEQLNSALPSGSRLKAHHLESKPAPCAPIFTAPSHTSPELTNCQSHLLSISIDHNGSVVHVFVIEVLIYSNISLTTLFVSKADSTGYLHLAELPKKRRSVLKTLSCTFLHYLIRKHRSSQKRLLLSLFARSQNQYLFPGSVDNPKKHVLSDRGLIKWWCQIFDEILQQYPSEPSGDANEKQDSTESNVIAKAYLRVPGCDRYETRGFLPSYAKYVSAKPQRWHVSEDPLREIASSPALPERYLIPRFPDDPKSRYMDSLDEELPENEPTDSSEVQARRRWRSVKSLEQFWDTMAFRQECSSGRLVGFLWAVFSPNSTDSEITTEAEGHMTPKVSANANQESKASVAEEIQLPRDRSRHPDEPGNSGDKDLLPSAPHVPPLGIPVSQVAHLHEHADGGKLDPMPNSETKKSHHSSRHVVKPNDDLTLILDDNCYRKAGETLLTLDYADLDLAKQSTKDWLEKVSAFAIDSPDWGFDLVGREDDDGTECLAKESSNPTMKKRAFGDVESISVTTLPLGSLKKKAKQTCEGTGQAREAPRPTVNTLNGGLIRKKVKTTG